MRGESAVGSRQSTESRQLTTGGFLSTAHSRLSTLMRGLVRAVRAIAGMPDYQAYLAHTRRCHPDVMPLDERSFFKAWLSARYADGPNRCC